jgi:hypothetical protein
VSLLLGLAGCGGSGQLTGKALEQQAATLHSLAAEGSMVAEDAARGKATVAFTRIHARELRDATGSVATSLGKSRPAPELAADAKRAASLAQRVRKELDALSRSGSDSALQRRLAAQLAADAKAAEKLGGGS